MADTGHFKYLPVKSIVMDIVETGDYSSGLPARRRGCERKQADKQEKDVCAFNGAPVPVQICSSEP